MYLIAMHQMSKYSRYVEGFHKNYNCITLWNDSDGLQLLQSRFFDYTSENRVPKYAKLFN